MAIVTMNVTVTTSSWTPVPGVQGRQLIMAMKDGSDFYLSSTGSDSDSFYVNGSISFDSDDGAYDGSGSDKIHVKAVSSTTLCILAKGD